MFNTQPQSDALEGQSTSSNLRSILSRRQFLGFAFFGALGVLVLQWVGALISFLRPVKSGGFGGMIYAGRVDEFPIGSVTRVVAGRCYISRTAVGFLALYQKCTHLGCAVPWVEQESAFHCPCHGSLFDPLGVVTEGPAPRPMDIFPVTIRSGEVWVDTSRPIERSKYDPSQVAEA